MAEYTVHVKTGNKRGAGTDGNVYISLIDINERESQVIHLDIWWRDDFEAGQKGCYSVKSGRQDLEHVNQIRLWRDDNDAEDTWYVETVVVERCRDKDKSIFPINRWVVANQQLKLQEFDSVLPQFDKNKEQRRQELETKQGKYRLKVHREGLPALAADLPSDEAFTIEEYQLDLKQKAKMIGFPTKLAKFTTSKFETLEDFQNIYGYIFKRPYGLERWHKDVEFGSQRLTGCNPTLISLCQEIPQNFPVTPVMVEPFLEGQTLEACLESKKIYIMDLKILEGIKCSENRTLCAPLGLFYVDNNLKLVPVAIQLFQETSDINPIFLPSDPEYTWLLAKMWFNNADASYHQAGVHLGLTHFLMEFVAVVTNRQLSPSHPLFRLLAPHLFKVIAINNFALKTLINPGGIFDKTFSLGSDRVNGVVGRVWANWNLTREGTLPNDLKNRGVDDVNALPNYHYRDDALLVYGAIEKYVKAVVAGIYDSPEKIIEDYELHKWVYELKTPPVGPGLKGLPETIATVNDISSIVTPLIFQASVQHAAVNFNQYDEYSFPPNYPGFMDGQPPRDKSTLSEKDVVRDLATKEQTYDMMLLTTILSAMDTKPLGEFEVQYAYDPVTLRALESFRKDLAEIDRVILAKQGARGNVYPHLNPAKIPNAISI
ncbi:unnamed protein product [Owenia fusiformis]|uniref:Uncharacterized protein n=1 Tax=Owenia fusiformis TaxID=6347 RepID=A0A8S4PJC1_OWEFU|nr:unnamed protein product [Owenia fusiformis]